MPVLLFESTRRHAHRSRFAAKETELGRRSFASPVAKTTGEGGEERPPPERRRHTIDNDLSIVATNAAA